jgi:TetR/AcrR family acrAB operon transcriptional repressor
MYHTMRRTKEEALITRENVLTAALRVFSQNGYSATRLEDIARAAEVTRGAIYHHFGSKEELYKALVTERSSGINQLAEEIVAEGGSPKRILHRLLVKLFEYLEQDDEYRALLELTVSKVEITAGLESIANDTVQGRRQLAAYFRDLLKQGIQAGEFRSDLPLEPAANALVSFMNGVGLIWIQDPRAFSVRDDAEDLVGVFLKGIEK